jgi:hypothetical protein
MADSLLPVAAGSRLFLYVCEPRDFKGKNAPGSLPLSESSISDIEM